LNDYLGGDGLANFSMDETIQLRGYPNNSLTPVDERENWSNRF
jgi:outer membrane protein insertion porin family